MPFEFSPETGRYRDVQTGRLVPEQTIRTTLDRVIGVQAQSMRDLSVGLLDGTISLADWQLQMMHNLKSGHLISLALANGGWNNLDQSDFGWLGAQVKQQYRFLSGFASDIASGKQPLNGTLLARSELYAEAVRQTHRAAQRRAAQRRGMEQERNQLGAADHCSGCLTETSRGWQPIGTLVPCGSRDCKVRCHCSLVWRVTPSAA